ncbi:ScyD/ScyE family protein [Nostoc flagelliforme FACHB-838]|uniref:ScyD/ScyE family protein n=1 Tax=Nostoc flagelliforme FACHB-838 TaxID=2692904 RepID=A0ABR8E596_9NOSO|nr:ScyD/ScyE family protein [Nostoc flagelliforme]MBD2536806.1 ScyD/ScyE family protein [Nostoc flagelliforme FACHB-838]
MSLSLLSKSAIRFVFITVGIAVVSGIKPVLAASFTVVADGLDNVRGLSFSPDGSLYVTEAGVGGDQLCSASITMPTEQACVGKSGAVTRIKDGKQERILTNLPSYALSSNQGQGIGTNDIQFDNFGNAYILFGSVPNVNYDNTLLNSPKWGALYKVDFNSGRFTSIADISSYEFAKNPNEALPNGNALSNPYSFIIEGNTAYIANAAANDVLSVKLDGSNLKTLVTFPEQTLTTPTQEIKYQAVPTAVAIGPDKALYISQLTGIPIPEGKASIFRVGADGQTTVYADGFTQLTDLSFDTNGNLYALQFANQPFYRNNLDASLIQIAPDGTRTTLLSGNGLESASALTIGPDGAIYVSNKGDRAKQGQVLRIEVVAKVSEPSTVLGTTLIGFGALAAHSLTKRKRTATKQS